MKTHNRTRQKHFIDNQPWILLYLPRPFFQSVAYILSDVAWICKVRLYLDHLQPPTANSKH